MAVQKNFETIDYATFRKEIKTSPKAGYLLFGDEDYTKSAALREAKNILCPDETFSVFNEFKFDMLTYTPDALLDSLMPAPMMSDYKLITVTGVDFSKRDEIKDKGSLEDLCQVLERMQEYDYNVVLIVVNAGVIDTSNLKKPPLMLQKLSEYLTPVLFEKNTDAQLVKWMQKHFQSHGAQADENVCYQMISYCGHSMFDLSNEVEKLSYYTLANNNTIVNSSDIPLVCSFNLEFGMFDFSNALISNNKERAFAILENYKKQKADPIVILSNVMENVCNMMMILRLMNSGMTNDDISKSTKIHAFRVANYRKGLSNTNEKQLYQALVACKKADAEMKGSYAPGREYSVIEKLICSI